MNIYCKIAIKYILRFLLFPLRLFPVKADRITLLNDLGSYADSPASICNYLLQHGHVLDICFACNPPFPQIDGVSFFNKRSLAFFIKSLHSRVFLTNNGGVSYMPFSRHTTVVNTWHGGGPCKRITAPQHRCPAILKDRDLAASKTHIFLSSCTVFSQGAIEDHLSTKESLWEIGLPRNDVFFTPQALNSIALKVRSELGLSENDKFVLYAPTFRKARHSSLNALNPFLNETQIEFIKGTLKKATQENWQFGYRSHRLTFSPRTVCNAIDLNHYPDMQRLLCAADALITDYSSSVWDFSLTGNPIFIFAPDRLSYERERGFYMPMAQWGFPIAENIRELANNILSFDRQKYLKSLQQYHCKAGIAETGQASAIVGRKILSIIDGDNWDKETSSKKTFLNKPHPF
ncbi:hypothetical protein FYJ74_10010 [Pyramidobacter sp. SM-530-WT-4B]|uniref:CDP-glycerol:poly(Glycerophosphate) glycerophosphotransferase n=1 Tax=Pyramidobacter porci TaxID=2605789 RepID=A0A6L5YE06_9BACT|nr:CDP-glycerol glycerophosphotransferase family protein [Pyramidobacter porci]MST56365.1 hypothetical protein [Pyramidobacter porci]